MQSHSPTRSTPTSSGPSPHASTVWEAYATRGRWLLRALVAIALLYTCHRALVLRIEYYDGYTFLAGARAMLGDPFRFDWFRPPMLSILELPAMLVVRASAPGSALRIVAPHCLAALISISGAVAILWTFRKSFSPGFALFGLLLFVGGRYFVRYGAHVLADLLSASAAAAVIAAYVAARERRSLVAYAAAGAAYGFGMLTKLPLVALGPTLLAAEIWYTLRARELDWRRWIGLVLLGVTGAVTFYGVQAVVFTAVFGGTGLDMLDKTFGPEGLAAAAPIARAERGETWRDWGPMAAVMLGPTLVLAAIGLVVALRQRAERDVPFIASLAILGGFIVFGIGHNEARYLLPLVPTVLYFAVRAVEAASEVAQRRGCPPAAAAIAGVGMLAAVLAPGIRQAWLDRDPVFFSDLQRRAAVQLLETPTGAGRLLWARTWHTFAPHDMALMPKDESFNTFHLAPFIVEYFIDTPVLVPPSFWRISPEDVPFAPEIKDGDAVLVAARAIYHTKEFPADGVPPVEVWHVRRMELAHYAGRFVSSAPPLSLPAEKLPSGELTLRTERDLGEWSVLASPVGGAARRRLGDVSLGADRTVSLGPLSRDVEIDRLVLAQVRREVLQ